MISQSPPLSLSLFISVQADARLVEELNFLANLPTALAERLAAAHKGASPPLVIVYLSSLEVRMGNRLNETLRCPDGGLLLVVLLLTLWATVQQLRVVSVLSKSFP